MSMKTQVIPVNMGVLEFTKKETVTFIDYMPSDININSLVV